MTTMNPSALQESIASKCPVDHGALLNRRKTAPEPVGDLPAVHRSADGTWHIADYKLAKTIMRGNHTRQAGFGAELLQQLPDNFMKNDPVLFQDGAVHQKQRREIARFFTPKQTSSKYRQMMEAYANQMIAEFQRKERLQLSDLTMKLAVRVAAEVVGLTNSLLPNMAGRIDAFINQDISQANEKLTLRTAWSHLQNQVRMAKFLYLDVKPAIRARRRNPQEDIISHLLAQGYSDLEILIECVTYGAAGMVTTREFIVAATWHFLENRELRELYLQSDEAERHQLLEEILRLEPVVGQLFRRTTADITLETADGPLTIPAGELVALHIFDINADEQVVGDDPHGVCPFRSLQERAQPPVMAFGDGHHRCPGAYVAIQETDIFLQKLLNMPGVRLETTPTVFYNETIKGYEIRNFILTLQ
jgi:cytochrome P450